MTKDDLWTTTTTTTTSNNIGAILAISGIFAWAKGKEEVFLEVLSSGCQIVRQPGQWRNVRRSTLSCC